AGRCDYLLQVDITTSHTAPDYIHPLYANGIETTVVFRWNHFVKQRFIDTFSQSFYLTEAYV
ncbi:MAG TPA: hypothetical protein PK951_16615, partial [Chitinophagaceae bacterium]|nr:hypothetical protein [Chitinophagaceae bacterium]